MCVFINFWHCFCMHGHIETKLIAHRKFDWHQDFTDVTIY